MRDNKRPFTHQPITKSKGKIYRRSLWRNMKEKVQRPTHT